MSEGIASHPPSSLGRTLGGGWRSVLHGLGAADPRTVAARLTLLLLVLYASKYWDVRVPLVVFATLGIVSGRIAMSPAYWAVIAAIAVAGAARRLYYIDNHKVLMAYWCIAMWMSVAASRDVLRTNARLLIGLCFLFATLWKSISGEFVDSSFMTFTMLTDSRFEAFAGLTAEVTAGVRQMTNDALQVAYRAPGTVAHLGSTRLLSHVATAVTWSTMLLEGGIAIAYLLAERSRLLWRVRNWILIAFLCTTYAVAPVIGFGWLLSIMGFAQCRRDEVAARVAFIATFILLQVFTIPWETVMTSLAPTGS